MKKLILALLAALALGSPAFAATCPTYPFTLINGQVADASQVMANFDSIRNCANNSLAPSGTNSTITALTGLTTPLSVPQGGTGANNFAAAAVNLHVLPTAGGTLTGLLNLPAATTSSASLNILQGVSPSFPNNGDLWTTSSGLFAFIAGNTIKFSGFPGLVVVNNVVAQGLTINMANAVVYVTPPTTHVTELDIPTNASIPFDLGTRIDVISQCGVSFGTEISVASGVTLTWSPPGTVITAPGSFRQIAACGHVTLSKIGTDSWIIYGEGLS